MNVYFFPSFLDLAVLQDFLLQQILEILPT